MPLRLNWFPWKDTKIWWSFRSSTAWLDISTFLLSWRLNCHFLPVDAAASPSELFLADPAKRGSEGLLVDVVLTGGVENEVEIKCWSKDPPCFSSCVCASGCSARKGAADYRLCTGLSKLPHNHLTHLHFCPQGCWALPHCWVSPESPHSLHYCGSHCSPWWWKALHPSDQQSPTRTRTRWASHLQPVCCNAAVLTTATLPLKAQALLCPQWG